MTPPKTRLLAVLSVSLVLAAASVCAAKPFEVQLFRPDSLAGWDHGDPGPGGWSIADGVLSGRSGSTPLLSGWTFGDFELRFRWSVEEDGAWKISLPRVPSGKGLELVLEEGRQCGRLTNGDTELSPGGKVKPRRRRMHTAEIRRQGGKLAFTVDGRWLYEVGIPPEGRFGLGVSLTRGKGSLAGVRLQEPPGEPMFNGEDFTGWWTNGDITQWRWEKGQVVLAGRARDYLRTEKQYANFTWSFEYKMKRGGNSGLSVRTPRAGWPTADGMEMQLLDTPYDAEIKDQPCMAIYGHVLPLGRADKSERWNRVVVKADGWMISAWVNGELVQHVNTFRHPELKHRHLRGWLGFQDHGAWIRVRNVQMLEAPAGTGLSAWYRPKPPLAVTSILDRLINPERLSIDDRINSGVAFKTFSGEEPSEHLLADLRGPGAVVRIARTGDEGRLAFYFDGEKEPRLECSPKQLQGSLPQVGKNSNPLLTCLTYRKSLKIVLREAAAGEYRFDYVNLPGNLPVETFTDPQSGFPRGWLPAATTILRWLGSGRFHQHDRLPRFTSDSQTIEPGQSADLVHVDGAGIVKSLKLATQNRVLDNNDLWLEVTIDGEKQPAVAAPARYLFPALRGNYDNYVLANQGGMTSMLAMPFADGITVSAVNRGGRPVRNVAATLSVERAAPQQVAKRMRLRGVFQPAQEGASEIISRKGGGRWVGLVYQLPEGDPAGIHSLLIDGRPVDGWSAATLDPLLGDSGEFRKHLSGRQGVLCWRYLLLAPVGFQQSLVLTCGGNRVGERLALFYLKK